MYLLSTCFCVLYMQENKIKLKFDVQVLVFELVVRWEDFLRMVCKPIQRQWRKEPIHRKKKKKLTCHLPA